MVKIIFLALITTFLNFNLFAADACKKIRQAYDDVKNTSIGTGTTCDAVTEALTKAQEKLAALTAVIDCDRADYEKRCYRGKFADNPDDYTVCVYLYEGSSDKGACHRKKCEGKAMFLDEVKNADGQNGLPPLKDCDTPDWNADYRVGIYCTDSFYMNKGIWWGGSKLFRAAKKQDKGKSAKAQRLADKAANKYFKWVIRNKRSVGEDEGDDDVTSQVKSKACRILCTTLYSYPTEEELKNKVKALTTLSDSLCDVSGGGAACDPPCPVGKTCNTTTLLCEINSGNNSNNGFTSAGAGDGSGSSGGSTTPEGGGTTAAGDVAGAGAGAAGQTSSLGVPGDPSAETNAKNSAGTKSRSNVSGGSSYAGGAGYGGAGAGTDDEEEGGGGVGAGPDEIVNEDPKGSDIATSNSDDPFKKITYYLNNRYRAETLGTTPNATGPTKLKK